jgi:hypothetical protein
MADATFPGMLLEGDHASRPAANTVGTGALYACSDHNLIYQSDGSSWSTWSDVSGTGSGVTQSFLGTTSPGASTEASVAHTWYVKSFTAPSDGILLSIDSYWATSGDGVTPQLMTGAWADSAGPTGAPLHASNHGLIGDDTASGGGGGGPSWKSMPCGLYVANATVLWAGVQPSTTTVTMYYAAGGSDRTWDHSASLAIGAGFATVTNSTKNYTIRFNFLSI